MKRVLVSCLAGMWMLAAFTGVQIDKSAIYKALASGEEAQIDKTISKLESEKSTSHTNAYIGALTMKKADFVKGAGNKVKTFKKGAQLLEEEIRNNPAKVEYRFLRLTVQEHAPSILKYNKQLDEDKEAVIAGFDKFDAELKTVVIDYAKESKVLKSSALQ